VLGRSGKVIIHLRTKKHKGNLVFSTCYKIEQLKMVGSTAHAEECGYAYDAAGNLNSRTNHTLIQTFNVNTLNELRTVRGCSGRITVEGTTAPAAQPWTLRLQCGVLHHVQNQSVRSCVSQVQSG
jgi:hypothetical protein